MKKGESLRKGKRERGRKTKRVEWEIGKEEEQEERAKEEEERAKEEDEGEERAKEGEEGQKRSRRRKA